MNTRHTLLCCLAPALLGFAACAKAAPTAEAVAAATQRAETAAGALTTTLLAELTGALAKGPAHEAVLVCADAAQAVTERTRAEQGIAIGRTALRVRNAKNAPTGAERAVLERWSAEPEPKDWSEVVTTDQGSELHWMRPIRLMPMCAQCHGTEGEQVLPATLEAIRSRYPDDRATGFAVGDLRGAVTVRVPL